VYACTAQTCRKVLTIVCLATVGGWLREEDWLLAVVPVLSICRPRMLFQLGGCQQLRSRVL
jgi:hypothetical protein